MSRRVSTALLLIAVAVVVAAPGTAVAQQRQAQNIFLPNVSPRAEITQTVGVTDISVVYHRPGVNGRDIFGDGGVVPYGQVWRTGANESTLISFSDDVMIEGEALPAGTYGLHSIPGPEEWVFIFNRDTESWGSFSYDESRDALRVTVKPMEAPAKERLAYTFDNVTNLSTTVNVHWADRQAGFEVGVDSHAYTMASIEAQLTGLAGFFWQGWNQAAGYTLFVEQDLEKGLEWADRSINIQTDFTNYQTKAQILDKLGRSDEAAEILAAALPMGNAGQLHNYGRALIGQGKTAEALEVFELNATQNPEAWFIGVGLARGYSAAGRFDDAAAGMKGAIAKAPENQHAYLQGLLTQLESGTDIN